MLDITEVRFKKIGKGNFLGYASICISNLIVIKEIKLFDSENGKYIIMPGIRVKGQKRTRNFAYPITEDARLEILEAIEKKYEEEASEVKEETED